MKILALVAAVAVILAIGWQHIRYLNARRGPVQDRQPLFYSGSTLHVVTFLRLSAHDGTAPGTSSDPDASEDVLDALRKFRGALEASGRASMVYAGMAASVGLDSAQVGPADWDAVVLVQYPSRADYDEIAWSSGYRDALSGFAHHYSHGLDRPVLVNLGLPIALLGLRAVQLATFQPSIYPLMQADPETRDARAAGSPERRQKLDRLRKYSTDALVVFNLLKGGSSEERSADRSYGLKMAGGFAEGGHGPMHIGRAVTLDGGAKFDAVAIVYYPGLDYMQELMSSTFFNGIVGDKKLGDTLAVPTVPVLSRL